MDSSVEFQPYLDSILRHYGKWQELYTLTDAEGRKAEEDEETPFFDIDLMVQSVVTEEPDESSEVGEEARDKIERLEVLEGLRQHIRADQENPHVLLIGRPGSGKSTTLARLMLKLAKEALSSSSSPKVGRGESEQQPIPVLVELRSWQTSVLELMRSFFKRHELRLTVEEVEALLDERRLVLLVDGVNELPSEPARQAVNEFRKNYPKVPIVFTTRGLGLGGDLGIEKQLEMQALTDQQMQKFIEAYLPDKAEVMQLQLEGRLRELGQTPLLLWMLCEVLKHSPDKRLPQNLGGIFQTFTRSYEQSSVRKHEVAALKGDVRPLSDRGIWKKSLSTIAERMMRGATKSDFRTVIHRDEAEEALNPLFLNEPFSSREILDDLLKYHLLQNHASDEIEFRHQLIQEYYAANWLLSKIRNLEPATLSQDYLNYAKWTESLAIMTSLIKDEKQAAEVIKLALNVDLMLGTRLAGEVEHKFQQSILAKVIHFLNHQEIPKWLQIDLIGNTKSSYAASLLDPILLKSRDSELRKSAVLILRNLPEEIAISRLSEVLEKDPDENIRQQAIWVLGFFRTEDAISLIISSVKDSSSVVRERASLVLSEINSEKAIYGMIQLLVDACKRDEKLHSGRIEDAYREPQEESNIITGIEYSLTKVSPSKAVIPILIKVLLNKSEDSYAREYSARILGKLGHKNSGEIIAAFQSVKDDSNFEIHYKAQNFLYRVNESEHQIEEKLQQRRKQKKSVKEAEIQLSKERITSPNPIIRGNAVLSLARYLGKESMDYVEKSLIDESPYVRAHGVHCFAKLDSHQSLYYVEEALYDPDLKVKEAAVQALILIKKDQIIDIVIKEELIEELKIQILRHSENHERTAYTKFVVELMNLDPSLSIRDDLKVLFLKVAREQDYLLQSYALQGLKNFSGSDVAECLVEIIHTAHFLNASRATEIIGEIEPETSQKFIPRLKKLTLSNKKNSAIQAIRLIQEKCRFYNYEIHSKSQSFSSSRQQKTTIETIATDINKINQRTKEMAEQPSIQIGSISGGINNFTPNHGTQNFTQIETQNNYTTNPELQLAITQLQELLNTLQTQNPNITNQTEALTIIDAEFTEIQTTPNHRLSNLRQQLLNPERHAQAFKATIIEVAKKQFDNSLIATAAVTYFDKLSETPDQGA